MIGPCRHYDCTNRNSFGYCNTTTCINQNYMYEELVSTSNRSESVVVKPKTNADRIRAMTDEELATLLSTQDEWTIEINYLSKQTIFQCWLDWLKQEVQDAVD